MAKLTLGDNSGAPAIFTVQEVPKVKCGVSIDDFIGDTDENGVLQQRKSVSKKIILSGVKDLSNNALSNAFTYNSISEFIADDLKKITGAYSLSKALYYTGSKNKISFASLEEVDAPGVFEEFLYTAGSHFTDITFPKLKKINGRNCFKSAFQTGQSSDRFSFAKVFPALEEISGNNVFRDVFEAYEQPRYFPVLKKITGGIYYYEPTFDYPSSSDIYQFPELTEINGYVWDDYRSTSGEIHFALKNKDVIEACNGYETKWGWPNATIYFDL